MKSKKTIIIGIGIIVVMFFIFKKDVWDKNEDLLREQVLSLEKSVEIVQLNDVTPFEWDTVYTFSPYTPKEKIYETVGYKWDSIQETVNEGMNQLVFLKDGEVVCYVYGYPSNIGYYISFSGENLSEFATVLHAEDNLAFRVEREEEIVFLIKE